jgi:hypothetical protein
MSSQAQISHFGTHNAKPEILCFSGFDKTLMIHSS